jgi:type VI secretion system secreted protein VgrG
MTLRPWLWLTGFRRNQRIFHNRTVVQILQELWAPYAGLGNPAWELRLSADYPVLEYTVQYRESDLDFALRMMERFGISYHFTHKPGGHTAVLTDTIDSHQPLPGGTRPFWGYGAQNKVSGEHFWDWQQARNVTTGATRLVDFNFKTPTAAMEADRVGDAVHAMGQIESFDWPGDYLDLGRGKSVAALRTQQARGQDKRISAEGDISGLVAGLTVGLGGQDIPGATGESFLCLATSHAYTAEGYGSGGEIVEDAYEGRYTLMPVSAPLAPPRKTKVAVVQGPQTAMVVGEGEIDCDEFGRILVKFHWDLAGANSMRCRVAQNWASQGWGGMVIPRIGMEVIVEFLEGDPDKPLVTGCVYNGKNGVPYGLPGNKTKSGFRTNTHQGSGFNELSFEDQAGREEISVHAQKDLNRVILDNETTFVRDGNRSIEVKTGDETKKITSGNLTESVKKTRAATANVITATANAGDAGPGVITYTAEDVLSLTVGDGTIIMTKEAIVLRFQSSQIVLTAGIIDQIADMIHLNKDKAG